MIDRNLLRLSDLHGFARLGVSATSSVADLVEAMHAAIANPHLGVRGAAPERTAGITGLVYRSIRGVTGLTGSALDTLGVYVHTGTDPSGQRRVREIVALPGRAEGGVIETADVFTTRDGRLVRADGYPPHADRFAARGLDLAGLLA